MFVEKGNNIIVDSYIFLSAAGSPSVSSDVLRYFISLNKSLIYVNNFAVFRNIAGSARGQYQNDKIEIMKFVYDIVKTDNRLNQFTDAIGGALENLIEGQPTQIRLDFITMILNDGFPVSWDNDLLLSSALFNIPQDAIPWVQFILSKGATVRRKHIDSEVSANRRINGDVRVLQLLLANVPDPANIPI
jgi:hypothetical protein